MKAWSVHSGDSASLRSTELKSSLKLKASKASEASVRGLTYAWARFTHNRHTTLYFLSSLIFCILIFLFQLGAWTTNKAAADIASALLTQANLSTTNFAAYDRNGALSDGRGGNSGILRLCDDIESSRDPGAKCRVVFPVALSPSAPPQSPAPTTPSSISITPTATPTVSSGPIPSGVSSTIGTGRMPLPTDATFSADGEIPQADLQHAHQHHFHNPHRQRSHQPRLHRRYLPHPDIPAFIREASHPQPLPHHAPPSPDSDSDGRLAKRNIMIEQLPGGSLRVVGLRTDPMTPAGDPALQKDVVQVSTVCVQSVKWALQVLRFAGSEDVASVFFQLWVLSMAIMALVNESVPYLLAALSTQAVSAIWSIASLAETVNFRADFVRISSGAQGACAGVDLLPSYWQSRTDVQIVMLVFNLLALGISLWLTYRLNSQFNWSVFKRIGASVLINKLYKLVLTLSILIQLTFFFIITSIALWIDQLFRGLFAVKADQAGLYKGISVIALLILLPWLLLGWVSVRRENRTMMLVFLCLSIFYLIVSFALCFSTTFQLTFIYWRFFAAVYVLTFLFVLATIVVGIMCRLNFGRGLPNYLDGQRTPGFGDPAFRPSPDAPDNDPEKVAFPSRAKLPQLGTIHRPTGGRHQAPPPPAMSSLGNLSTCTPSVRTSMSATAGHSSLRSHPSRHSHVPSSLSSLPRKSIGGDYAPGMGSPVPPPIDTAAAIAGISTRRQDRDRSGSDREGRSAAASGLSSGGGSRSRKPRPESVMLQRAEMEGLTQDAPRPPPPAFAMPPAPVSVPIVPTPGAVAGGSASEADQGDASVVLKLGRKTSNLARAPGIRRFARGQQANAEYAAAVAASTAGTTNLVTGSGDLNPFSDGEPTQGEEVDEYESSSGRQQKQKQAYDSQSMRAAKVKSFHPTADQPFMSREQMEERMGFNGRTGGGGSSGNGGGTVARQETSSTVASYGTIGHANSTERKMMAAQPTLGHMDPEMSDDSVGGRDWRAGGRTAPAKAFQKKRTQE